MMRENLREQSNTVCDPKKKVLLEIRELSVSYGTFAAVKNVSFTLEEGHWMMIVGPNGAGKSTVLRSLLRAVPYNGTVTYLGKDIRTYRARELARHIGALEQNHAAGYAFRVGEVVRLGRYPYGNGIFAGGNAEDEACVARALEQTGLRALEDHLMTQLSGGELQRMFLAQVFAQDPEVLLLDEPTNHLDPVFQKQIFDLVAQWVKRPGRAVISVVHDLSLAKAYGTDAVLMDRGEVKAQGEIASVLTRSHLEAAYEMDVYGWMKELLSQWDE